jgi:hypothetical protein
LELFIIIHIHGSLCETIHKAENFSSRYNKARIASENLENRSSKAALPLENISVLQQFPVHSSTSIPTIMKSFFFATAFAAMTLAAPLAKRVRQPFQLLQTIASKLIVKNSNAWSPQTEFKHATTLQSAKPMKMASSTASPNAPPPKLLRPTLSSSDNATLIRREPRPV